MGTAVEILLSNLHLRDVNPLLCGEERCAPCHAFGPAIREYYLIHYILSGKGRYSRNGKVDFLKKGDMFLIRPHETTYYEADQEDPWHYCWIGFESALPLPAFHQRDVLSAPECGHIFQAVLQCGNTPVQREYYLTGKLYELFAALQPHPAGQGARSGEYITRAINYLESNYMNPIRVSGLAAKLGLERSYFSSLFKRCTGTSPQQYLTSFRLRTAAELLSSRRCTPSEAAASTGYSDLPHFCRMFKARYGVSPSEYAFGGQNIQRPFQADQEK